jgi:hypothetical protein
MLRSLMMVLPIAIGVNILLGSAIAQSTTKFDKAKFLKGIFKAGCIYAAIGGLVLIAQIIPVVSVDGLGEIDIINSLTIIVSTVFGLYITQALQKLIEALKLKIKVPVRSEEFESHGTE